jgi:exonuclease III
MHFRAVSWNLNGLGRQDGRIEFLSSLEPDVAILLEVTPSCYESLKADHVFPHIACSLDLCSGQEKRKRPLGCVIASKKFPLSNVSLLQDMPIAERALVGSLSFGIAVIDVCAFHAPPGVNWGKAKSEAYVALSKWMENRSGPAILGMDGNSPKVDHPDHARTEFWRESEDKVLGVDVKHRLRDSLRVFLESNPNVMSQILEKTPTGPLALSYDRGKASSVPCRYDFVMVSPEFQVKRVEYPYGRSIEAGSDHSAVVVDLMLA